VFQVKLYYAISENSHLIRSDEILSVATPGEGNFITIKKTVTDRLGKPFSECVDEPAEIATPLALQGKSLGSDYRQ